MKTEVAYGYISRSQIKALRQRLDEDFQEFPTFEKKHAFDCDIFSCDKEVCQEIIPDKIVSKPYVVIKNLRYWEMSDHALFMSYLYHLDKPPREFIHEHNNDFFEKIKSKKVKRIKK